MKIFFFFFFAVFCSTFSPGVGPCLPLIQEELNNEQIKIILEDQINKKDSIKGMANNK